MTPLGGYLFGGSEMGLFVGYYPSKPPINPHNPLNYRQPLAS